MSNQSGRSGVGSKKHRQVVWSGKCKTKNRSLLREAQRTADKKAQEIDTQRKRKHDLQEWKEGVRELFEE